MIKTTFRRIDNNSFLVLLVGPATGEWHPDIVGRFIYMDLNDESRVDYFLNNHIGYNMITYNRSSRQWRSASGRWNRERLSKRTGLSMSHIIALENVMGDL